MADLSLTQDALDALGQLERLHEQSSVPVFQAALRFGVRAIKDRMTLMRGLLEITDSRACPRWVQDEVTKMLDQLERGS